MSIRISAVAREGPLMFATTHAQRHDFLRLLLAALMAGLLFFWSSCARINGG